MSASKKIMVFSTYPVVEPRHGGQIRTVAMLDEIRSHGITVLHFCVYERGGYQAQAPDKNNICFDKSFFELLLKVSGRTDVDASSYFFQSDDHFLQLSKAIQDFTPDTVMINQPWLWPAVKAALSWLNILNQTQIIYSSQNVESILLTSLLVDLPIDAANRMIKRSIEIEADLCQAARTVICVSESDRAFFSKKSSNVILAPNGISPRCEPGGIEFWRKKYDGIRLALMVGSAHPPNANGFVKMLSPNLAFLAPNERILIVGGACHLISEHALYKRYLSLNNARVDFLGVQNDGGLSTFIEISSVIILPITEGGGTNIKTAEALYNKKNIVATSESFRGYEDFMDLPNVRIVDDPHHFQAAIRLALNTRPITTYADPEIDFQLKSLTWSESLKSLHGLLI